MSETVDVPKTYGCKCGWKGQLSETISIAGGPASCMRCYGHGYYMPVKEVAAPAPATETPTITARGMCGRCHNERRLVGNGAICGQCAEELSPEHRISQLERELADARAAKPTKWGWWATLEFDIEDPQCVACGVTMQLNEGCEWPDFSELCLCGSCATKVLEELRPLTLPAGPDGGEG